MKLQLYPNGSNVIIQPITTSEPVCPTCYKAGQILHECGRCYTCCVCYPCHQCGRVNLVASCEVCSRCPRCCQCFACRQCGVIYRQENDLCQYDSYGFACGCCQHRTNEATVDREFLRFRSQVNLNRYVDSGKRLTAAEIELCGFEKDSRATTSAFKTVLKSWHASGVSDGSLPYGGIELNTHPAAGDYWVDQITDITTAAHGAGVWVNQQAGCHIHVDCRDLNYLGLAKAVRLFGCLEPALFSIIPRYRVVNTFCHFWAMNYLRALQAAENSMTEETTERKVILTYRKEILRAIYGFHSKREVDSVKQHKHGGNRYRAVNLHSFLHRGTIEMRMPPGTIYADNIINWGLIAASIIDYAVAHSMVEVMEFCRPMEKKIIDGDLFGKPWSHLNKSVIDTSMTLLSVLAPTKKVRDWLVERRKWAVGIPDGNNFRESSKL